MSFKVGTIGLYVQDIARAKQFYTEILGCKSIPEFSSDTFIFLSPACPGPSLYLQGMSALPKGMSGTPGGVGIGFIVEDIHAVWKEWKTRGVEILTDVNDMGAGLNFYAKDPDGHSLCITQLYPQVETMRDQLGITV